MGYDKLQSVLLDYFAAVDAGQADAAAAFLDPDFRVQLHNYPKPGETTLLSREQYLAMMRAGKVGGNPRKVHFLITDIEQQAALVKVKLDGGKTIFTNYYTLLLKAGNWTIVSDVPQIEKLT